MADPFQPKFVDLVRNNTTTTGTGNIVLGQAVQGHDSLSQAVATGERFYYCITGVDKPAEREVGRGTLLADGTIKREPNGAVLTNFTSGNKTIALVAGADWFTRTSGWINGGAEDLGALTTSNKSSLVGAVNELASSNAGGGANLTFSACAGAAIASATKRIDTSGFAVVGSGPARYVNDPAVTSSTVAANPRTQFLAADGRGFSLDPTQHLTIEMFGGRAGGTMAANGAENLAAMQAAASLKPDAARNYSSPVHFGVGTYYCSATFSPLTACYFVGATQRFNGGVSGYVATRIVWPVDTCCISQKQTQASTFEGLSIEQLSQGAALNDAHGIVSRFQIQIRRCVFVNIAGHCIEIGATAGSVGDSNGNANEWRVEDCQAHSSNGDGLYIWGGDANGGYSIGFKTAYGVGGCGIRDTAYLTNTHIGPQITGYGARGVSYGGKHYQLISSAENAAITTPGTNNNIWYEIETGPVNSTFPTYVAGTLYQPALPMLLTGQGVTVVGPYVEFGATISHSASAQGTRGNAVWTRTSGLPDVDQNYSQALVTTTGMGFSYSNGGNATDPMLAANGTNARVLMGTIDPDAGSNGRRNILEVAVQQDGDSPMLWRWQGKDQRLGYFNGRTIWSISGAGTARTFGRNMPQPGIMALHDYALIDPDDGNNALIHGLRSARPATGSHALGEYVWSNNPSAGVLGWSCVAAGTPGTWVAVTASGGIVADKPGTTVTATLTDANGYLRFADAAAITFTVPANATVPFPIGTVIELEQAGSGALNVAAGAGVTINSRGGDLALAGQFSVAALKQVAVNVWTLTGDL